jgi:SAM-dependent methyltransferase
MRAVEDRHWWYVGTRAIARDVLVRLPLSRQPRILDAGCGTGGNAAQLLRRFGPVVGIDLSDLALELAAEREAATLVRGSVSTLPFRDATFDLVTSFEVLYHRAVDDRAALRELGRVLVPRGFLLLRLPALEWLRGAHDEAVHTARRYTAEGLRSLLVEAGLEPLRLTYLNSLLLPLAAAKRIAERVSGVEGDDLGDTPPVLEAGFRAALAAERRLVRRFNLPLGVSVLALARRPGGS